MAWFHKYKMDWALDAGTIHNLTVRILKKFTYWRQKIWFVHEYVCNLVWRNREQVACNILLLELMVQINISQRAFSIRRRNGVEISTSIRRRNIDAESMSIRRWNILTFFNAFSTSKFRRLIENARTAVDGIYGQLVITTLIDGPTSG